jgi:CBS domain-containing protein
VDATGGEGTKGPRGWGCPDLPRSGGGCDAGDVTEVSPVPVLADLRLRPVIAVGPGATLATAARLMRAEGVSSLIVGLPGELVSVVTERDLCGALADGLDAGTQVARVATPHPVSLPASATVLDAGALMLEHGVRHVIVTIDRRAVGVVSVRDVLVAVLTAATPQAVMAMVEQVTLRSVGRWS